MTTKKQRLQLDKEIAKKIEETIPEDNNEAALYIRTNMKERELNACFKGETAAVGLAMFQIATQNATFMECLQNAASAAFAWNKAVLEKKLQNKFATKVADNKEIN